MNILITGSNGFVGTHVASAIVANKKHHITGFDLPHNDFTDKKQVEDIIQDRKIDCIIHIGAMAGLENCMNYPLSAVKTNVLGTAILLECAKRYNCKFIYCSTWAVNGHLQHPYDITKKAAEDIVKMYHRTYEVDTMILRMATMYGPGMRKHGVIWAFLEKSLKNEVITIQGDGSQFRQFLWIEDAAQAFIKALEHWKSGCMYEIQPKDKTTIKDIAYTVYMNNHKNIKFSEARKGDEKSFYVDSENAEVDLKWKATMSLKKGMEKLKEFIEHENLS